MLKRDVWMARSFLAAAGQAAHEWYAEMGDLGPDVIGALDRAMLVVKGCSYAFVRLSLPEMDALAIACSRALSEVVAGPQTMEAREYRQALVDALAQLSKLDPEREADMLALEPPRPMARS